MSRPPTASRRLTKATRPDDLLGGTRTAEMPQTNAARWLLDNRAAMESWNDYIGQHGLPLAEHRLL